MTQKLTIEKKGNKVLSSEKFTKETMNENKFSSPFYKSDLRLFVDFRYSVVGSVFGMNFLRLQEFLTCLVIFLLLVLFVKADFSLFHFCFSLELAWIQALSPKFPKFL